VTYGAAPSDDYFGTLRKTNNSVDVGAVEFTAPTGPAVATITGGPLAFGNVDVSGGLAITRRRTGERGQPSGLVAT
jgi:hypothetical protein